MEIFRKTCRIAATALLLSSATFAAQAASTLETVKARGKLICGVSMGTTGFALADAQGKFAGFDVDVCRAVASAVFGDPNKVDFVLTNINTRFQALQSGEIDILSRQTTMTYSREASLGIDFGPTVFYDGQGLMVNKNLGVTSAKDLDGAAICTLPGTTTAQNLADFFRASGKKFELVVFETRREQQRLLLRPLRRGVVGRRILPRSAPPRRARTTMSCCRKPSRRSRWRWPCARTIPTGAISSPGPSG
jgi:general L-amino acid transport system substrate-binding protein